MEEQSYIKNGVERLRHRVEVLDGSPLMTVPPEVIREVLSRLEQAERNADTYQKLYEQRAESLEQAEQAVARVRELAEAWKSRGEHDMEYSKIIPTDVGEIINEGGAEMVNKANLILSALDGDARG